MEVTPGYKQTVLGLLPEEWDVLPLRDACRSICDGTHFTPRYVPQGVPFYSVENITAADFVNTKFISEHEHIQLIKRCKPERGDILMTRITAGVLGATKLLDWDVNASIYVSLALLKPNDRVVPEYLYRYTQSPAFRRDVEKRGLLNATPKKINMRDIGDIPIPAPLQAHEQKAIAQALSDIDELIQSLERLIAKKRDLKQAAMQQLLTGQTRLPGFSGEWPERSFADLFIFSGGFSASREQLSHVGHCYLHYGDIHMSTRTCINLQTDLDSIPRLAVALNQVSPASLLADGDVVFVDASEDIDGTSRHVVVANPTGAPFISGLHTIVAKSRDGSLDREYKRFCFQAETIKRQFRFYAVGTKVSGVSKTNIARMSMQVPSVPEQKAIAEVLSDMDAESTALEARLAKTRDLKQGMMQELLTGRTRLV